MSRKKPVSDSTRAPAPGRSTGFFSLVNFVAAALVIYLSSAALYFTHTQQTQRIALQQTEGETGALATRLSDRMRHYRSLLSNLAADPRLAKLFLAEDAPGLRAREEAFARLLPDAWRIRLLPKGLEEPDTRQAPHMSFASLDILRTVENSGKASLAEAHQLNSKHRHIALAVPVLSGSGTGVVGLIHAAFPLTLIQGMVDDINAYGGRIEVRQLSGGKALTLAANAGTEEATSTADSSQPIPGTIWEVAGWSPSPAGVLDLLIFFGIPTGGVILVGLALYLQWRRLQQALKSDQGAIVQLAEDLSKGVAGRNPGARVSEFNGTLELLTQLGTKAAYNRRSPAASADESAADKDAVAAPSGPAPAGEGSSMKLPDSIFRAYDIRGIAGDALTRDAVYELGRAIGSEAYDQGQQTVIVARDGRLSGEELSGALCQGLQDSGRDVLDLGMVPVPVLYFATHYLDSSSGVMLTGSHNPPEYNGLKVVINGEALSGESIRGLKQRVENGDLLQGNGAWQEQDLIPDYLDRITSDVQPMRTLKVVVDCGNGVAGTVAPILLRALDCEVIELFCDLDGSFPNHHPDPGRPENLQPLIQQVQAQNADLGVAFDGDGDRIGVVDSSGKIIWPDRLLMLFAADVLSRQPGGDILYDIKSTRDLASQILAHGGRPVMWKTGHSLMKAKLKETGALLAGEMSGHIFFKERWFGFDDALYACARLLEILSADPRSTAEIFAELPESVSTPELIMPMDEGTHHVLIEKIIAQARFPKSVKLITIDGLRTEFEEGWGLVRASNTTPSVVFRFEADHEEGLKKIKDLYRQLLLGIDPQLKLPF